jgi:hypothetical protein
MKIDVSETKDHIRLDNLKSEWLNERIYLIKIYSMWRWFEYINITITILDIIHRPVFYLKLNSTQLNSVGFSVPHRKHIMSPLRIQQVNATYRFVTMVY